MRQPASPIPPSASDTSDSWLDKAPAPSNESDLPAWLSTDSDAAASDARGATSGDMSLPSWLRGVTDEPVAPPAAPRSPSSGDSTTSRRRRVNEDAEGDDFLKGTELPSWLRPIEPEPAQPSPERKALDWLTRLGGSEENENEGEGVSSLVPEPAAVALPARRIYERSPEQIEALALLERLVHSPYPAPVEAPLAAAPSRWQKIGLDRVLYMLFMLVLLIGMIVPAISTPFQTTTPSAPGAVALNEQLAQLSEDDVVLIAYEWNAQRASELRPLETAITSKLIAQRSKLILLSTNIQGTMLSFELRGPLRAAGYNIDPNGTVFGGRDYILLGYRPGGELALRRMAQNLRGELTSDFEGHDATPSLVATNFDDSPRISSLNDLAMIIVMADQPQDVQAWMEQIHSAAPAVPIAFLLPQETAPLVQPYLRLPNVYHLAGLPGALALQAQGEEVDTQMIAHMSGQQGLAIVTLVVLVIVSSLGVAIARARRTQRGAA
nr:hypothetical protein [Oscillochloris trichoides]